MISSQRESPISQGICSRMETADGDWVDSLLNVADVIGPLSHEFGNILNNIVLQAAIMTREVPEPLRAKIANFRALGLQAGKLLGQLDQFRRNVKPPRGAIDLHELLGDVQKDLDEGESIQIVLPANLPAIAGNDADLRRLFQLLLRGAIAAGAPVALRAEERDAKVWLIVEDSGADIEADALDRYFDPCTPKRAGENAFERAICHTIARRLQAPLRAERLSPHGLAIIVELQPADTLSPANS